MEYPYKIAQRPARLYWTMLSSLVFVAMGVFLLFNQAPDFRAFTVIAAILNIAFFGGGALLLFRQARKSGTALLIDTAGIHDDTTLLRRRLISWEDIRAIRSDSLLGNTFLLIDVHNPEDFIKRMPGGILKKMARDNAEKFGTPVYIPTKHLNIKHEELVNLLQQELEQYRALPEDLRLELKDPLPRELRGGDIS